MNTRDSETAIEYLYANGEEYYTMVEELISNGNGDGIEPVKDSASVSCVQDHDPLAAFVQDQTIVAVDTESSSVVGFVSYQSGLPSSMGGLLDSYTPCVYLSQIIVDDVYSRSGVLDGLLETVKNRVSERYEYFVTRVWSGNRNRLHEIVASDFTVALEMDDRVDDVKSYYYVCSIKT